MIASSLEAEAGGNSSIATCTVIQTRREAILALSELAELVRHGLSTPELKNSLSGFDAAFSAECIGCAIRISGKDLLQLASGSSVTHAEDSKIDRLRKGYCARRTCESRFYDVTCIAQPGVDWDRILAIKDGYASAQEMVAEGSAPTRWLDDKRRFLVGLVVSLVLMLLVIGFQYYIGGTIPFLRQPEKFRVDPDPILPESF